MNNQKEKLISIFIIILSLLAFAVAAFLLIFRSSDNEKAEDGMPAIVGFSVDDVSANYGRYFTLDIEYDYDTDYDEGVILSQSISPDEPYKRGDTVVKVMVSGGKKSEQTTASTTEQTVPETTVTEPVLQMSLLVDSPSFDFETMPEGEPSTVITSGIDRTSSQTSP